jgi:hypothetical protein
MKSLNPRACFVMLAVGASFVTWACNGFSLSLSFVVPRQTAETNIQTVAMPAAAGLIVSNDNGSTRVVVDPAATQATVQITRVALAQTQAEADDLLAEIVVTVDEPDGADNNLRITAPKPAGVTNSTGDFQFEFEDDELIVTGILSAERVALVRLKITLPPIHAVQVTQGNGPVRGDGLDVDSALTATNGDIRTFGGMATLTLRTDKGRIEDRTHTGNVDALTANGAIEVVGMRGNALLRTSNGRIQVDDHRGSIDAAATNGGLEIELDALAVGESVLGRATNGRIDLNLPRDIDAQLRAAVGNGSVSFDASDFLAVNGSITTKLVNVALNNGGPSIDVETNNGLIDVDGR